MSVTVAQLNGNGIPDLLVANQGSNDVSEIFGSDNSSGDWVGIPGPRLNSGGDGPIAVIVADLTDNSIPDLAVVNGGSGTVTMLPGVGGGFFDDQDPLVLFNLGSAVVQPPTFTGTSGLGYAVTAGGNLVRFDLANPAAGASVVYSGEQVVAAQALANGQVVAALADGAVDLLNTQGNSLNLASVLQAQAGVPTSPSSIDVVSKPSGQFSVLVSSEGSDNLFVFAPATASPEGEGGGVLPATSSPPALNSIQTPTLSSATASVTSALTTSAITTSASATTSSTSSSSSTSAASVSSTATSSVGLSLGGFSSLGNRSVGGSSSTILVPVEGNTYLSVPILDLNAGNEDEDAAGKRRMPGLSSKFSFGDTSPLTRFVIGLDEAIERFRGADQAPLLNGPGALSDPWNEDLFHQHLPALPPAHGTDGDDPHAMLPEPHSHAQFAHSRFARETSNRPDNPPPRPATARGASFMALAGLIVAMRRPSTRARGRKLERTNLSVESNQVFQRRPQPIPPFPEFKR